MAVSVVACQVPMIDPEDALSTEFLLQTGLDLSLCEGLVTMRCQQTACGGEDCTTSVALDGAAFQHEVETIYVFPLNGPLIVKIAIQGIILRGRELLAPAVETKIK